MSFSSESEAGPVWWRNPWVLAALVGVIGLPLMRPILRSVPEPPPVVSEIRSLELVDLEGTPFGLDQMRGRTWLVSVQVGGPDADVEARLLKLQEGIRFHRMDVGLASVWTGPGDDGGAGVWADRLQAVEGPWAVLRPEGPEADRQMLLQLGLDGGGQRLPLVLVDPEGRVRGHYKVDDDGVEEAFFRAQRVEWQFRQERG